MVLLVYYHPHPLFTIENERNYLFSRYIELYMYIYIIYNKYGKIRKYPYPYPLKTRTRGCGYGFPRVRVRVSLRYPGVTRDIPYIYYGTKISKYFYGAADLVTATFVQRNSRSEKYSLSLSVW